ncbi:MAG: hypothetical protein NTZ84_01610 [Candidatus Nealsonbacteria bacterium]|nr:hypothetical protein [Candidatus Nealsonbacteria bacterium]
MKRKNKKIAIVFLLLVFVGIISPFEAVAQGPSALSILIFPICPTCAIILQAVGQGNQMVADIGTGLIKGILGLIGAIPVALLEISQSLLSWVISPNFLTISMTGPDNVVVAYGWSITRDLANIFLLLGLVVIGLGIILGLEEYQAKKTLPKLIAIALLINFTLVICGFILDFANLLMNYLLGAGSLGKGLFNEVQNGMSQLAGQDFLKYLGLILIFFIFGMVGAIVYALYALLFIARYVFLWILIIISPIAFVSKVFPSLSQAKQFFPSFFHWDEWWKSFIQWATVGIYAAFFIALANNLMTAMASGKIVTSAPGGGLSALGSLFSYLFPLALLLIGLFSVLDSGSSVPGFNKAVGYGKAAIIGAGTGAAITAAGMYKGATDAEDKRPALERIVRGGFTTEGRAKGEKSLYKTAEKIPIVGLEPGSYEAKMKEKVAKTAKGLESLEDEDLRAVIEKRVITERDARTKTKGLNEATKRGILTGKDMDEAKDYKIFGFDEHEALKRMPHKAGDRAAKKKLIQSEAPADFAKNTQKEAFESGDIEVFDLASANQIKVLMEKGSDDKKQALKCLVEKNLADYEIKIKASNAKIEPLKRRISPLELAIEPLEKRRKNGSLSDPAEIDLLNDLKAQLAPLKKSHDDFEKERDEVLAKVGYATA